MNTRSFCLFALGIVLTGCVYQEETNFRKSIVEKITKLQNEIQANGGNTKALNEMRNFLTSKLRVERVRACCAVGQLGSNAVPLLPELMDNLECGDPYVEREATISIIRLGSIAKEAIPILEQKISSSENASAFLSAEALGEIGIASESTIEALQNGLTSESEAIREECQAALDRLSADEKDVRNPE